MNKAFKPLALLLQIIFLLHLSAAHGVGQRRALLGAQIWIEPGQKAEEIDRWFRTLAEAGMPVARLFMMWNYLEPSPARWDFQLYDAAFRAAEKYHVRVVATLTPNYGPAHRGYLYASQGGSITDTRERLGEAQDYIARVVGRYRLSPALDSWMLMNEPGQRRSPDALALERYKVWLRERYRSIDALNAAWTTNFSSFDEITYDPRWIAAGFGFASTASFIDWSNFWREHLAWYLGRVAAEIRRTDPAHPLHVNPHALVGNLDANSYDLPAWRSFLDSLGASIHPSWHFWLLRREQFALGVSYVCDLVRGSSEPKPFWVTELQGGNNLYSGARPLNPTESDIAQWVWTSIGSGADRVIFWLLNARMQGGEAGEWSLTDFQGRPSERLKTASEIASVIGRNQELFERAKTLESTVTIILSLETMALQERFRDDDFPGRGSNAHVQSALAFYETLSELGIPARVKQMHDFDWRAASLHPRLVILPHASAITAEQARDIEVFVKNGNTLLVTDLSGIYDAGARFLPLEKYPLENITGARLREIRLLGEKSSVSLRPPSSSSSPVRQSLTLPVHLWAGEIENLSAEVMGQQDGRVMAVSKRSGRGQVIWIPSMVGLGAWLGDNAPLAQLLSGVAEPFARRMPFRFVGQQKNCLMRVMQSGASYITVLTNGGTEARRIALESPPGLSPKILWGEPAHVSRDGREISLGERETIVILWR